MIHCVLKDLEFRNVSPGMVRDYDRTKEHSRQDLAGQLFNNPTCQITSTVAVNSNEI